MTDIQWRHSTRNGTELNCLSIQCISRVIKVMMNKGKQDFFSRSGIRELFFALSEKKIVLSKISEKSFCSNEWRGIP